MNQSFIVNDPKPMGGRVLNNSESFWHLGHSKRWEVNYCAVSWVFWASSNHIPVFCCWRINRIRKTLEWEMIKRQYPTERGTKIELGNDGQWRINEHAIPRDAPSDTQPVWSTQKSSKGTFPFLLLCVLHSPGCSLNIKY